MTPSTLKIIPGSRIIKNLESVFGTRTNCSSVEDYLAELDQQGTYSGQFPFRLSDLRVLHAEVSVIDGIMRPSNRRNVIQFLTEMTECPMLLTDIARQGKNSLFVAMASADRDILTRWIFKMHAPEMLCNFYQGDYFIAASLLSFIF